jgi:E3 ubiquitin-protein ligase RNF14
MPCLNSYAKESLLNIQEKQQITCYQCDTNLNLSEIRRIFSDEKLFMKYQQHFIDMISCPRCHKSIVCIPSESQSGNHRSFAECLYCCFTFCRRCEESWHPQIQCPKEKIVQEIIKNPSENRPQLNKIDLNKLLLEIETIQAIEQCSKPCPSCSVRIEKNGGCQHMHCRACQIHFCWTCGWFGPGYAPHPCKPKPVVSAVALPHEIQEKILVDENGKIIQSDKIKRVQICPRPFCREVHVKIGTKNMILCSKCEKHFCFLCGEAIYGLFHYSEYGCKVDTKV